MTGSTPHPSDISLQRALDHELSPEAVQDLARHLDECSSCRLRMAEREHAMAELSALVAADATAQVPGMLALRARLESRLSEISAAHDRSWWLRLEDTVLRLPLPLRAGLALIAVAIAVNVLSFARSSILQNSIVTSVVAHALPIRPITPGAVSTETARSLCGPQSPVGSTVSPAIRFAIVHDYGMDSLPDSDYELDYLVTPELGGIADRRNLWPEPYRGEWNARVKDQLERLLQENVCTGRLELATAQEDIETDWIAAYRKYFQTDRPLDRRAGPIDGNDDDDQDASAIVVPRPRVGAVEMLVSFVPPDTSATNSGRSR